jgi:PAS domain S-box-containing protein
MMAQFLQSQLDYIFFFYGLAFLLLVPICLFLRRRSFLGLPWIWLVWFGALHGTHEWLDFLALSLEPSLIFSSVRLVLLIMSFVCLAEFGRAGTYTLRGRGPGPWILALMTALVGLGGLAGYPGLLAATHYVLGLTGGIWAAGALFLAVRKEPSRSRNLQLTALAMAAYALATGLVVMRAPFFPASWLNYHSFFEFTGVPIQLIRGLLALWISASLCLLAETCLEKEPQFRIWFHQMMLVAMTIVALLLTTGWLFTQHLGNIAMLDKWDDCEHDAEMLSQSLANRMGEADRLVKVMSGFPAIFSALASGPPQALHQANTFLDICSQTLTNTVCYLMNLKGLTIASSNRARPDSFLRKSYAFRPYFQQAIQGSTGRYWALGVTSKKLGYYTSVPVRTQTGQILGAVVIKRSFPRIQTSIIHFHDLSFIIDRHGIVVMASKPDMVLRSLWPLSAAIKQELLASRQFGNGTFPPILDRKPADKSELLLEGKRFITLMRPIPGDDCSVVVFGSTWPIAQARLLGISATMFFCSLLLGFLTIVVIMRGSEEGFRQLFDHATDSLILHDRGRIIEVNQQTCYSLGYTREELSRMSLFDIEVGYSKEFLIDLWEKGEGVVTLSGIYRRKDGLTFPTEIRAGEITYRGQTLRLAAARDVSARKQAEEALQESEEYYRSLFNNMLNGYAYCQMYFKQGRPVDFIFLNVNKAFGDLTGLMDVIGKKVSEAIPGIRKSDPEFLEMCGRVALTGIPERDECYVTSLKMWFSISVYSPLKEYFVAIFDVITERKQAEEALLESQERLRLAAQAGRLFAFEWNPKTDEVIRAEECGDILGLGSDATRDTGEGFFSKIHPEDRAAFVEVLHRLNPKDDRYTTTYRVIRQTDGQVIALEESARGFFDSDGKLQRLYGMTMDITERQRAEEALLESEKRFRDVAESAQEWVWEVDAEGKYTYASPIVEKLLGYKPEEILDKHFYDLFIPEERNKLKEIAFATFAEKQSFRELINRNLHKDGSIVYLSTSGVPILDKTGNLLGYRGADIDITKRKKAEEELRASEAALRQSQERYRLLAGHLLTAQEAERKKLARELHDDLSQRLAALAMEAETLEHQKSPKTGPDRASLKEMKDKLVELSIDVHAMSRRLHPSILDDLGLADAVASECATFRKRNGVVVNFRTENIGREVPPNVAVCLYRIVQEALRNISRHAGATEAAISLVGEDQAIRLLIRDNGKGFDPGQKTSTVGLGLDSMKERAHLIGADFSLESQPGGGTMIEVLAPLSRRPV